MIPAARAVYDRVKGALSEIKDIRQIPRWLEDNTASPIDPRKRWSFDKHEFQREILADPARDLAVVKVSQVGLSEVQLRWILAMSAIYQPLTSIYTLPTSSDATNFAKERVDRVIEESELLSGLVKSDVDSASLKRIGTSFIHFLGTMGKSAPISVPAQALVQDEVDFSNQRVLNQFESRLGHGDGGKYRRFFSTPTTPGYGISRLYDKSSQGRYAILHTKCGQWVCPTPLKDVLVPVAGFTIPADKLIELDRRVKARDIIMLDTLHYEDVLNGVVSSADAVLMCPHCRFPIPLSDMADPARRKWVHKYPDVKRRGYSVSPWDAPEIKTLASAVHSFQSYEHKQDFLNFGFGVPYRDAESTVSITSMKGAFVLPAMHSPRPSAPCYIGVDLGHTSWLVVLRPHDGKYRVIWYETIVESGGGELVETIYDRFIQFNASVAVIDASPDFTTSKAVASKLPGRAFGAFYVGEKIGTLGNLEVREDESTVRIFRTRAIDALVKELNAGKWEFARQADQNVLLSAVLAMEKVHDTGSGGKITQRWTHSGPDHYFHAMNYARAAAEMDGVRLSRALPYSAMMASKVAFGKPPPKLQVPWLRHESPEELMF